MAVTYRRRKQAVPYRTRLTGWLMFEMRGSAQHAGPLTSLWACNDLLQQSGQRFRCGDVRRVAGVEFVIAPTGLVLARCANGPKVSAGVMRVA